MSITDPTSTTEDCHVCNRPMGWMEKLLSMGGACGVCAADASYLTTRVLPDGTPGPVVTGVLLVKERDRVLVAV